MVAEVAETLPTGDAADTSASELLTVREAALRLGITTGRVYQLIAPPAARRHPGDGELLSVRLPNGELRIARRALDVWRIAQDAREDDLESRRRLARNLRYYRQVQSLTQEALGKRLGGPHQAVTIRRLERGEHQARQATVRRIAKALGVTPAKLYEERA